MEFIDSPLGVLSETTTPFIHSPFRSSRVRTTPCGHMSPSKRVTESFLSLVLWVCVECGGARHRAAAAAAPSRPGSPRKLPKPRQLLPVVSDHFYLKHRSSQHITHAQYTGITSRCLQHHVCRLVLGRCLRIFETQAFANMY